MTHASSGIGCRTWGFDYRRRGSARDGPANILWCSARKCVTQSAAHIEVSEKSSVCGKTRFARYAAAVRSSAKNRLSLTRRPGAPRQHPTVQRGKYLRDQWLFGVVGFCRSAPPSDSHSCEAVIFASARANSCCFCKARLVVSHKNHAPSPVAITLNSVLKLLMQIS